MTATLATLELSRAAYDEISEKLLKAGYSHAFHGELIDMSGIGLMPPDPPTMTDSEIDAVAASMPGGEGGFLKSWGWRQFAREILAARGRHK